MRFSAGGSRPAGVLLLLVLLLVGWLAVLQVGVVLNNAQIANINKMRYVAARRREASDSWGIASTIWMELVRMEL